MNLFKTFRRGEELFWVAAGQIMVAVGGIVGVRMLTGVLSPVQYGELALAMTVSFLANQVFWAPLSGAALRFYSPSIEALEFRGYTGGLVRLVNFSAAVLAVLGFGLGMGLWLAGGRMWAQLVAAGMVLSMLLGTSSILNAIHTAARHRKIVAWHDSLGSWLRWWVALAFIQVWGASSGVALGGYVVAAVLVLVSQGWFFRRKTLGNLPGASETGKWEKSLFTYAWPFATWGIFTWGQMASDRWGLEMFTSTGDVGRYAVLYQLGWHPIALGAGFIAQLIVPLLFSRAGDGNDARRIADVMAVNRKLVWVMLILTLLAVVGSAVLHRVIFKLLVAPEYHGVSSLLPWMVLAGGLFAAGQSCSFSLLSRTETRHLIAPKIITALLGTIFNLFGAWCLGLKGVVLAGVCFSAIYFVWMVWLAERSTGNFCAPCGCSWKRCVVMAAVMLAGLYAGEGVLHWLYRPQTLPVYGRRHTLGMDIAGKTLRLKQREFDVILHYNSFGFRDDEFPLDPSFKGRKIVFLGDSFVEGFGVEKEERLSEVLQGMLNAGGAGNWRVINLGQTATNPDRYFKNLVELGIALKPELVVIGIFMGNDFMKTPGVRPSPVREGIRWPVENPPMLWISLGYTRALIRQIVDRNSKPWLIPRGTPAPADPSSLPYWTLYYRRPIDREFFIQQAGLTEQQFKNRCGEMDSTTVRDALEGLSNPAFFVEALKRQDQGNPGRYYQSLDEENVLANILECQKVLRARNIRFLVLIIPDLAQVREVEFRGQLEKWGWKDLPTRLRELPDIKDRLVRRLRQENISCLDLTPGLRNSSVACYYPADTHFNTNGHRLAAGAVFDRLGREGVR